MTDLEGKRVLVAGASTGIGRGIAIALVKAGAAVAVAGRRREVLDALCGELEPHGLAVDCDLRTEAGCLAAVIRSLDGLGGLDAVVYAAGVSPLTALIDTDASIWRDVMETNVIGASLVCRAALPHLSSSRGQMVFLGSASVGRPRPGLGAYAASKAALDELVTAWRTEHPDVSFSTVVVGRTLGTEFNAQWDRKLTARAMKAWSANGHLTPAGAMEPSAVGEIVCSVLSAPASIWTLTVHGTDPLDIAPFAEERRGSDPPEDHIPPTDNDQQAIDRRTTQR